MLSRFEPVRRAVHSLGFVTTALDAIGAAAVVVGVAFIYGPAAYIAAGVAVLFASWSMQPSPPKPEGGSE